MEEQDLFIDSEYKSEKETSLTFREIVLQHLNRCIKNGSVEMHGGYYSERPVLVGGSIHIIKSYISDSREVYINSVDALHDLLIAFFDEEMKKNDSLLEEELSKTFLEFKKAEKKQSEWIDVKLKIKRKLFQQLCTFLYGIKFLETKLLQE